MTETSHQLLGRWKSNSGEIIVIRRWPIFGLRVSFTPVRGRSRSLKIANIELSKVSLFLSWLGHMEAMLHLRLLPDPENKETVLVPELEAGPESSWDKEDFGFPWLCPLEEFRRVSP
jgi:hypothetical protein